MQDTATRVNTIAYVACSHLYSKRLVNVDKDILLTSIYQSKDSYKIALKVKVKVKLRFLAPSAGMGSQK